MLFIWSDNNVSAQDEWHVYPGDSIQGAVDSASAGDTIYVHAGTYAENIDVNKRLNLIGDGMEEVMVEAEDTADHTFYLTADGITMTGFMVTNSYLCGYGGICIEEADNCKIHDNKCTENLCAGIFLKHANYCEIIDCIVSNNNCGGIKLAENSNHNTVTGNIMENNKNWGINVYGESNNNLIYDNYFAGHAGVNLVEDHGTNTWNTEKTPGENIIGGPYLGGNYYDLYEGSDSDGDGIGDIQYQIPGGDSSVDHLPLVEWTPQPELYYDPHSHNFGDMEEGQTDSATFEIWNSGTGILTYSLSESCGWVDVHPTNGDSTDEDDTITVSINTTGLDSDDYTCPISISSNGGSGTFTVTATVVEGATLSYDPHSHNFGDMEEGQTDSITFEIWNSGTGTLTYSLSESCGWVDVYPTSGDSTDEDDTITVSINTTGLSVGSHNCDISITSNGGNGIFPVAVNIVEEPVLAYNPTSHDFENMREGQIDNTTFEIWNLGTGTLTYTLSETCNWINISQTSGDSTGEHDTITVNIGTAGLSSGNHTYNLGIGSNGGSETFTVTVTIVNESKGPILSYTPYSYDFESINKGQTDIIFFEIWNSGNETLNYTLSETCSWVDVSPTSSDSTGERDTVTVYVNTTGLKNGSYTCDISISSNGGNDTFTITLDVPEGSKDTPGFQAVIVITGLFLFTIIYFLRKKRGEK